ncbi:hypothetical protein AYI69_g1892 [Smittium culicis]|uniref:Uncharacterized protein n=1 Tax=Smittium culicis TaxID=133412 RepID=A0A1R1X306_9FUNG|nr:hypothetical protein AYI69_g10852 [Smittium culicis]OMJ28628.1 hypothetical protein AYI69_g1892 [Smittium culicis]
MQNNPDTLSQRSESNIDFDSELDSLSSFSVDSNIGLDSPDYSELSEDNLSCSELKALNSNSTTSSSISSGTPLPPSNIGSFNTDSSKNSTSKLSDNSSISADSDESIFSKSATSTLICSYSDDSKQISPNQPCPLSSNVAEINDKPQNLSISTPSPSKVSSNVHLNNIPKKSFELPPVATSSNLDDHANTPKKSFEVTPVNSNQNLDTVAISPINSSVKENNKSPFNIVSESRNSTPKTYSVNNSPRSNPVNSPKNPTSQYQKSATQSKSSIINDLSIQYNLNDIMSASDDAESHRVYALKSLSIIEIEFAKIREHFFTQKNNSLDFEMKLAKSELHPDLTKQLDIFNSKKNKKLSENDVLFNLKKSYSLRHSDQIKSSAHSTFLERKQFLSETLISKLTHKLAIAKDIYAKGITSVDSFSLSKYESSSNLLFFDKLSANKNINLPIQTPANKLSKSSKNKSDKTILSVPITATNELPKAADYFDLYKLTGVNESEVCNDLLEMGITPVAKKSKKDTPTTNQKRKLNLSALKPPSITTVTPKLATKTAISLDLNNTLDKKAKKKRKTLKPSALVSENPGIAAIAILSSESIDDSLHSQLTMKSSKSSQLNIPHNINPNELTNKLSSVVSRPPEIRARSNSNFNSNLSVSPSTSQVQNSIQPIYNEVYCNQQIIKPSLNNILLPLMPQNTNSNPSNSALAPSNLLTNDLGNGNYYSGLTSISPKIAPNYSYVNNKNESNAEYIYNNQFNNMSNGINGMPFISQQSQLHYNNKREGGNQHAKPIKLKSKAAKDKAPSGSKKNQDSKPGQKSKSQKLKLKPKGYSNIAIEDNQNSKINYQNMVPLEPAFSRDRLKELTPIAMNGMTTEINRIEPIKKQSFILPVKEEKEKI